MIYNDGLPEPIFLALQNDQYDKGDSDYTPSSLNSPPFQARLEKDMGKGTPQDKTREPASSKVWALFGSAVHYIVDIAGKFVGDAKRYVTEHRYYGTLDVDGKPFKIGSQVDIHDIVRNGIYDMKVTGTYGYGKTKDEWIQQLNVNRWCIFQETGLLVDNLNIVAIWRDWTKSGTFKDTYPPKQITNIEIPIWELEEVEEWMRQRIRLHEAAKALPIGDVPPCSDKEVWAKKDIFSVTKAGAARAAKNCATFIDAQNHIAGMKNSAGYFVNVRKGARPRCEGYCSVSEFCSHFKAFKEANPS